MSEILVVGGGVYGCAIAWELARQGHEVRLIEAHHIASGVSDGPGRRGVRANMRDVKEPPLMALAHQRWPVLYEELAAPAAFERTGHLTLLEQP